MSFAYINIGSNKGDNLALINKALNSINQRFGICCLSSLIQSEPWGFESDNRFLNLGVSFKTDLHPEELLSELQTIEKSICPESHRDDAGNYIDREIDIDIMAIDNIRYCSPSLQIPHRHIAERDFFLIPLKELNPDLFLEIIDPKEIIFL